LKIVNYKLASLLKVFSSPIYLASKIAFNSTVLRWSSPIYKLFGGILSSKRKSLETPEIN